MKADIALAFLQSKTGQLVLGLIVSLGLGFFTGRVSVNVPEKTVFCKEYIDDRNEVSKQLGECRGSKIDDKKKIIDSLTKELGDACDERVKKATEDANFSPRVHCAICMSKGHCK